MLWLAGLLFISEEQEARLRGMRRDGPRPPPSLSGNLRLHLNRGRRELIHSHSASCVWQPRPPVNIAQREELGQRGGHGCPPVCGMWPGTRCAREHGQLGRHDSRAPLVVRYPLLRNKRLQIRPLPAHYLPSRTAAGPPSAQGLTGGTARCVLAAVPPADSFLLSAELIHSCNWGLL